MTVKTSTGLRNAMLVSGSFKSLMDGGSIKIYAGAAPASADAAIGAATLLATITNNGSGTGLTFEAAAVDGVVVKKASEIWSGTNSGSGTATFYRFVAPGDDGAASTTQARIQGSVAVAGGDLNISSVALVAAAPTPVDYYSMALPSA